jgi:hypothetical protein
MRFHWVGHVCVRISPLVEAEARIFMASWILHIGLVSVLVCCVDVLNAFVVDVDDGFSCCLVFCCVCCCCEQPRTHFVCFVNVSLSSSPLIFAGMSKDECMAFVQRALAHAMARDGSSGGVIRTVTIDKDGVTRGFVPGDKLPFDLYSGGANAAAAMVH